MGLCCASLHGITALLLLISLAGAQSEGDNTTPSEYQRFSPSLVLTLTGIVVALFFLVFLFALYVRYCDNGAIPGTLRAISGGISRRPAAKGLDKSEIETFPTFVYSSVKELKIGKGALECAVCLSEFDDDETLRLIPNCSHVFHPDCIAAWLASHTTCPVCRAELSAEKSASSDSGAEHDGGDQSIEIQIQIRPEEHLVMDVNEALNRNRTRGSRSGRPRKFPRSHSTGHSQPVQPGEDTERFTLRLPAEVRRQIMKNRLLQRSNSMVVLPTERSFRWECWTSCEGSGRGRKSFRCPDNVEEVTKSDRWVLSVAPPFLMRAVSDKAPKTTEENRGTSSILPRAKSCKLWNTTTAEDYEMGDSGSPRRSLQSPIL